MAQRRDIAQLALHSLRRAHSSIDRLALHYWTRRCNHLAFRTMRWNYFPFSAAAAFDPTEQHLPQRTTWQAAAAGVKTWNPLHWYRIACLASSVHVGDDSVSGFRTNAVHADAAKVSVVDPGWRKEPRAYRHGTSFLYVSQSFLYLQTESPEEHQHLWLTCVESDWSDGNKGAAAPASRPLTCARMPRRRESDGVRGVQQSRSGRSTAAAS